MVDPERLRFDFSHYDALGPDEIARVEDMANHEILANFPVRHYETTKEFAEQLGAIAFFGDKYGDIVRVLEAGAHSIELCGGTHVRATGDIGLVKIVSEGSIGSNLRRIEAITGFGPIERIRRDEARLGALADQLGVADDEVVDAVSRRVAENKELRDEIRELRRQAAARPRRRAGGRGRRRRGRGPGRRRGPRRPARAGGGRARSTRDPSRRAGRRARGWGRGHRVGGDRRQRPARRRAAGRRRPHGGRRRRARAPTLAVAGGKDRRAALDEALDQAAAAAGIGPGVRSPGARSGPA